MKTDARGGQKRVTEPLGMDLQAVVSHLIYKYWKANSGLLQEQQVLSRLSSPLFGFQDSATLCGPGWLRTQDPPTPVF